MNWKVFIVYHKFTYPENYKHDKLMTLENYVFLKVGSAPNKSIYENLELKTLPNYIPLGKHYAEYEAIYNVYKNPYLYENLDFIGFNQYDKPHIRHANEETNITEQIINSLQENIHISLESHPFNEDFNQHIMMDKTRPNELTGDGKNCYYQIIEDYNKFHHTYYNLDDIIHGKINLCSAFILPVKNFKNIMKFISYIIESGKLDIYDTNHQHRIQAGLLERYMGISILFEQLNTVDITIQHLNQK